MSDYDDWKTSDPGDADLDALCEECEDVLEPAYITTRFYREIIEVQGRTCGRCIRDRDEPEERPAPSLVAGWRVRI